MIKLKNTLMILAFTLIVAASCTFEKRHSVNLIIVTAGEMTLSTPDQLYEAAPILKMRLLNYGFKEESIILDQGMDKISLTIHGVDTSDIEIIKGLLTTKGETGFWETYDNSEVFQYLSQANERIRELGIADEILATGSSGTENQDTIEYSYKEKKDKEEMEKFRKENPLFGALIPMVDSQGNLRPSSIIGLAKANDTAGVITLLRNENINIFFPHNIKFAWSPRPYQYDSSGTLFELHALKISNLSGEPLLDESDIASAKAKMSKAGDAIIDISFTAEGMKKFSRMTRDNVDRCIAILIDGYVATAPKVMTMITSGNTEITGSFSREEAILLSHIFSSGCDPLPVELKISAISVEEIN
jgi:SecD/SecF fusion protein